MAYKIYITENCIYKIDKITIGFFCKIPFKNKNNILPILIIMSKYKHNIYKEDGKILISNDKYKKELFVLNRRIYKTENNFRNYFIIEIKEEDGIDNYLELDDRIINNIIYNKEIEDKLEPFYLIDYEGNVSYFFHDEYKLLTLQKPKGGLIFNVSNKIIGIGIVHGHYNIYFQRYYDLTYSTKEFIHKFYNIKNE